jgi:23S rRNA G2445 N2-methylase RlmL
MKSDQDLYKRLRDLPKERLWNEEVGRFNAASLRERMSSVAVIRAVGSTFGRFGTEAEKMQVRDWLISLLGDPQEKIRRYAAAALPKIGAGEQGEEKLLDVLKNSREEREQRHLGRALEKVGGAATLALGEGVLPTHSRQKVQAGVARRERPASISLEAMLPVSGSLRIHLRCRRGLEGFVKAEVAEKLRPHEGFRVVAVRSGCVTLEAAQECTLATLYRLRTFATLGIYLGTIADGDGPEWVESLAACIASPRSSNLMKAATDGVPRYRIDFPTRGHQRGAIRRAAERAYERCPDILNDSREAPWSIDVIPTGEGRKESYVELRPRLYPDPRLSYRQDDIPAASHPPLAACMARLAGTHSQAVVWDPFCGSGLELVERGLLGGVKSLHGTDLDPKAIAVAQANFSAATLSDVKSIFTEADFRDALRPGHPAGIRPGSVSLIITNPPLGRRVRVKDMQGLFDDLYHAASVALKPGGCLIFANPLRTGPTDPSLKLEYRQAIDMGGFECRLEMYRKIGKNMESRQAGKSERS